MNRSAVLLKNMLMLSEKDVRKCLSLQDCLDANRTALMAVTNGTAHVPSRLSLPYQRPGFRSGDTPDWTLIKPATHVDKDETLMGMKIASVRDQNAAHGLPTVVASILVLNAQYGHVEAIMNGTYLTAARTAAGSALSVQTCRPDVQRMVVFGAGLQAELHLQLIATAIGRTIPHVTIVNRSWERAKALKARMSAEYVQNMEIVLLSNKLAMAEALSQADVIVTATNSTTPLFDDTTVQSGCHVAGVGSYTPDMAEVPAQLVDRAVVLLDTPAARDVGDLASLRASHPYDYLGNVLSDTSLWPQLRHEHMEHGNLDLTFFKSVGTAIQDLLTAQVVVDRARELGLGTQVDMS